METSIDPVKKDRSLESPLDGIDPGGRRDLELISKALAGDAACSEILVDRLLPIVQRQVSKALRRRFTRVIRQDVEDLTQEILLQLFIGPRVLRRWQPARGLDLEAFVGFVSFRRALSKLGGPTAIFEEIRLQEPSSVADPERRMLHISTLHGLWHGLRRMLTPESWRIFELRFIQQVTIEQIAARMEIDRGAVYARISRIRKIARQVVDELESAIF